MIELEEGSNINLVSSIKTKKTHRIVSWAIIAGLLILRIPFLAVITFFSHAFWVDTVFQTGTYLLTAFFLLWECENLEVFHVDVLAIWIILLFKPIQTLILAYWRSGSPFMYPHRPSLLIWAIAIGLGIGLWFRRKDLPRFQFKSLGWFGIGMLAGIFLAVVTAIPGAYTHIPRMSPVAFWFTVKKEAFLDFIYQTGYAGVTEEPLFRGFLWGALHKAGLKEIWIFLLQAGLFTIGHIYYWGKSPIALLITVPILSLGFGLIVWKSRTISASLAAHGTVNSLGILFDRLAAYYLK